MSFYIVRTEDAKDLPLPARATPASSGMDLHANVTSDVIIKPGERKLVPIGIKIVLPIGYEAQLRPRSGLALKAGIGLVNSPATIDADYRGEIKVILINWGDENFIICRGDRVAQMVICPVAMPEFIEVADFTSQVELLKTQRGEGGFGHSGI